MSLETVQPELLEDDPAEEARAAVRVGLWVSATRCVLTYVVAPVLGAAGVFLGPVGLFLQVAGAITSTSGAARLWRLDHRLRWPYAGVAAAVCLVTVLALAQSVVGWLR